MFYYRKLQYSSAQIKTRLIFNNLLTKQPRKIAEVAKPTPHRPIQKI